MKKKNSGPARDPAITSFESFLKIVGFKRTDGAIYGLLVLNPEPLSSEEIGQRLGLSQGAVSQGLKNLAHWGAIDSQYAPERRVHLHSAAQDSLSIVATVFQKREKGAIEQFRRANEQARERFLKEGDLPTSSRITRLQSNITTCEFAQVIMDFTIGLSRLGITYGEYARVIRALPKALSMLAKGTRAVGSVRDQIISRVREHSLWG